jgi:catechol 2,3-dioxygenase-like lactoylglutathione lyase family enzyme
MEIKMVGPVIFVKDIRAACGFYTEVMGQKIEFDFGPNIGFVGGLSLWERAHATPIIFQRMVEAASPHHNDGQLYFETDQLDEVCKRLENTGVEIIHPLIEQPWGSRSIHFYDLDGHIVELAEPMSTTIERMLAQGMTIEAVAHQTGMPLGAILEIAKVD